MNKNRIRIIAALLAAVTAIAGIHVAAAASADRTADAGLNVSALLAALNEETDALNTNIEDEAAYIFTDATGAVRKVIVSDWQKDGSGDTYTRDESNGQVPVDMKISYTLDGRQVQPSELAGQSGQVTIKFDYVNNEKRTVEIDGQKQDIYVPFLMLTGMILDNEHFSNVEVKNGKLINDGSRQIVMGYALPGLKESLALTGDQLEIPDAFTVSADVKGFQLDTVLTFASTGLFDKVDTDNIGSLDELKESLGKMTDAMDQLIDGASQLQSGLETLLQESGKLESGVKELADGAETTSAGASQLAAGAGSLTDGASQLYAGLSELTSNSSALNDGAAKVFTALLNTAQTQIRAAGQDVPDLTISNYSEVLDSLIRSLDDEGIYAQALAQVSAGVDAAGDEIYKTYLNNNADQICLQYLSGNADAIYRQYIESEAESVFSAYVLSQIPEEQKEAMTGEELAQTVAALVSRLTDEQKEQILAGAASQLTDEQKEQILAGAVSQLTDEQREQILAGAMDQLTDEQKAQIRQGAIDLVMASEEVQAQMQSASESVQLLTGLKAQLDTYNQFYQGLRSYTAGVASATEGAGSLVSGCKELQSGADSLSYGAKQIADGCDELRSNIPSLLDGITQLRDGSAALSEGLNEFNQEAIQKLSDVANEDLDGFLERLRAVRKAGEDYENAAQEEGTLAGAKLIYRMDAINK